jgi:nucleoside-diphosphate-sugar epimerase
VKVFITGGAGYVGSLLVPKLLADGCKVTVYDTMWFGNGFLPTDNENLRVVTGDIRDVPLLKAVLPGHDAVIHLACISNDVSCQLDEALSTTINFDAFEPLVIAAREAGVRRFIYCSSSSVYGVSTAPDVTEEHPLVPLTLYNRYKGLCEPLLFKHQSPSFECVVIRPATVCGYAPRMRFDLTVNIMTNHAVRKNSITVYGGNQRRPNLHIDDMCDLYRLMLAAPAEKIAGQIFNVGQQNLKVSEIAQLIQQIVYQRFARFVPINTVASQDNRSYHINSDKIFHVLGFKPKRTVEDAINDICVRFESGYWPDSLTNPWYVNVLQYTEKYGFGKAQAA